MADLIELDLVVRDKGLKASVSTVERLERQIIKAQKAVDKNTISQARYNKILLTAKREYQALGVSSQKATGQVRAFAAASKQAQATTAAQTVSLNSATAATTRLGAAQSQTKNKMNGNNMAVQQLGYQVGDFAVQVQGGTSAFTAFSQQGAQLAGILPSIAGTLGMSMGAAVGLSAALGILIPIGSAIGRMFFEMGENADKAKENLEALKTALEEMKSATKDLSETMSVSLEGMFKGATEELKNLMTTFKEFKEDAAKQALATAIMPLTDDIADVMDLLNTKKSRLDTKLALAKRPGASSQAEKNDITREINAIAKMQFEVGGFFTGIQKALKGPSEDLAENMLKVSKSMAESELTTNGMKDKLHLILAQSGLLIPVQDRITAAAKEAAKAEEDKLKTLKRNSEEAAEAEEKRLQHLSRIRSLMGIIDAERIADLKAIEEEDNSENIKSLAKLELDLIKANAKYKADQEALDAAGDLAILNNNARRALELAKTNSKFDAEQAAIRLKEAMELDRVVGDMAKRLAIPFAAALALIRQAKKEAAVDLDAFGGPGAFKYSGSSKFDGEAFYDERVEGSKKAATALAKETKALKDQAKQMNLNADATAKYEDSYRKLVELQSSTDLTEEAFSNEVAKLNEELANSDPIITGFTDAFTDFLSRGAKDFKGFAKDIMSMFKNMIVQMIATAARNKIMLSLGMGGSSFAGAAAQAAGSAAGGGMSSGLMGGALGGAASSFGAGIGTGMGAFSGGFGSGMSSSFGAAGSLMSGGGASGFMSSLGAAMPALLAVTAIIGLFTKKTKLLDEGLQVTANGIENVIESFKVTQSSRFFGLFKGRKKTSTEEVTEGPLAEAVNSIGSQVSQLAGILNFGADTFDDFSHEFKLSLKGMTEEEQLRVLQEELLKMGDAMASLVPLVGSFNELNAVAQERLVLEAQMLQAEGNLVEIRKRELATVHELNKSLAARLQLMQAEADVESAIQGLASAVSERQGLIQQSVDALVSPLQEALDRFKDAAKDSFKIFKEASGKARTEAKAFVDILRGALNSRRIKSEAVELQNYRTSQQQLTAFAGGAEFDKESLGKATKGVSIDSEKFFGSFADYARDFYKTQITLEELEAKASQELTDVEVQIAIAEKAFQMAMNTYQESVDMNTALDTLLTDLAAYNEVSNRNEPFIEQIKAEGDRQIAALDDLLLEEIQKVKALSNMTVTLEELVGSNVSVGDALAVLGIKEGDMSGAVLALATPVASIGSHIENFDASLGKAYDDLGINLKALVALDIAGKLETLDFFAPLSGSNIAEAFAGVDLATPFNELDLSTKFLEGISSLGVDLASSLGEVNLSTAFNIGVAGVGTTFATQFTEAFDELDLTSELTAASTVLAEKAGELKVGLVTTDGLITTFTGETRNAADNLLTLNGTVVTQTTAIGELGVANEAAAAVLQSAMTGDGGLTGSIDTLGGIVSGLGGAISNLATANGALAAAQAAANAAKAADDARAAQAAAAAAAAATAASAATAADTLVEAVESLAPVIEIFKGGMKATSGNKNDNQSGVVVDGVTYSTNVGKKANDEVANAVKQAIEAGAMTAEDAAAAGVKGFASGGYHSGGLRVVGENGPELEATGPSRIYSSQQTKSLMSGGSGEVVQELRSLRREVSELKSEQRKVGVENVKYNKKSYDLYREWDTVGLPATRTS